jgi:hypothetical protein
MNRDTPAPGTPVTIHYQAVTLPTTLATLAGPEEAGTVWVLDESGRVRSAPVDGGHTEWGESGYCTNMTHDDNCELAAFHNH